MRKGETDGPVMCDASERALCLPKAEVFKAFRAQCGCYGHRCTDVDVLTSADFPVARMYLRLLALVPLHKDFFYAYNYQVLPPDPLSAYYPSRSAEQPTTAAE
eukprot:275888-Prorocentrum_minimum.AAC.6